MTELGAWDGVLHAARDSNRMYEAAIGMEHMTTDQPQRGAATIIFTHKHPAETVSYINSCDPSLCARALSIACERWGDTMPHEIACVMADALDGFVSGVSRTEARASLQRVRREHVQRVLLSRRDPTLDVVAWSTLSLLEDCQDARELLEAVLSEKIKCDAAVWRDWNAGDTPVKYAIAVASGSEPPDGVPLTDLPGLCIVAIWSKTALRRELVSDAASRDYVRPLDTTRVGEKTIREAVKKIRDGDANLVLEIGRRCSVEDLRWWLKEAPAIVIERWVDAATEKRTVTSLAEALVWARESQALGEGAATRVRGLARDIEGGGYVLGYLFGRAMSRWCHSSTDWRIAIDMSRTWDGTIEELGRCVNALGKH